MCPDFVVELRSDADQLRVLQDKMQEYMDNGTRLGWLIDPQNQTVEIYRAEQPKQPKQNPQQLSGEDMLPGFLLDLSGIF